MGYRFISCYNKRKTDSAFSTCSIMPLTLYCWYAVTRGVDNIQRTENKTVMIIDFYIKYLNSCVYYMCSQSDRTTPDRHSKAESPASDPYRSWDHRRRRSADSNHHQQRSAVAPEPKPDYSPEPERRASNGSAAGRSKKVYQKTRFAADATRPAYAPAVTGSSGGGTGNNNNKQERKKSFGESFRRLVGKFTGTGGGKSQDDRKKNRKKSEPAELRRRRRTGSGSDDDYENDNDDDDDDENTYRSYDGGVRPTAADHHHQRLFGSTQTLDRHRAGRTDRGKTRDYCDDRYDDDVRYNGDDGDHHHHNNHHDRRIEEQANMNGRTGNGGNVHRYYLGEDPFGGSIYGREREYDGTTYNKRRPQHKKNSYESQHTQHYVQR